MITLGKRTILSRTLQTSMAMENARVMVDYSIWLSWRKWKMRVKTLGSL